MKNASNAPNLGETLKALRLKKGLSLQELARLAGFARSTLYKVENRGMSLTYEKLIRLSEGLGVEISQLFRSPIGDQDTEALANRRVVGRQGDGDLVLSSTYEQFYLCNDIIRKGLIPIMGHIRARSIEQFDAFSSHPGEEFTYVLDGTIEVHTKLYRPAVLNKGDFIYLDSSMQHAFISTSKQDALVLTVCTRPDTVILDNQPAVTRAAPPPLSVVAKTPRSKGRRRQIVRPTTTRSRPS